jgi:5-methylcytosine-specific restriction endonuclease McrA
MIWTCSVLPTPERELDLQRLGDEIAELAAHLDAATARLLELVREFDARGGWGNGFRSCAEWLTWRIGLAPGAAREHVRVARALGTLPRLSRALARGEVSYSKARAITRVATPDTEERLLAVARGGTAQHVERIVRAWRAVDRKAEVQETAERHRARALHVYQDEDGMVIVRGRLEPEAGAVLIQALAAARDTLHQRRRADVPAGTPGPADVPTGRRTGLLVDDDPPTFGQQQADALTLIAETALHQGLDPGTAGERYQVVVHVDAAVLADADALGQSIVDGARVSAETSQRLACDASRVVMRHDADGGITEIGARTRTIPPALRRALHHRDQGCRFPGCGSRFGQGHHIRHWAHGGPTALSNLATLCRRHHRAVHEEGYQVTREASGDLSFRTPQGWMLAVVPATSAVATDPVVELRARNDALGLRIDAHTSTPSWRGERLDLGYAIDVLHPLANEKRELALAERRLAHEPTRPAPWPRVDAGGAGAPAAARGPAPAPGECPG